MRAWIGCLASYNNGVLHGEWFDISADAEENGANIDKVIKSSRIPGAEEYYVANYEAPKAIASALGEYPGIGDLAEAAEVWEAMTGAFPDEDEAEAALAVMLDGGKLSGLDAREVADWVSDHYAGKGDTLAAWCEEHLADTEFFGDINDGSDRAATIVRYFDFEAYARDLRLGGEIHTARVGGSVLVFWSN